MKSLKQFIRTKQLLKSPFISRLSRDYFEKAKYNLITTSILFELQNNAKVKDILSIPKHYDSSEWITVTAYYAMYLAALSGLAKIGYKSSSHEATVLALEKFFVKKKILEEKYLKMLETAELEKNFIDDLKIAKQRRQIAQYSVTKDTSKEIAEKTKDDAFKFVDRIEELLMDLDRKYEIKIKKHPK